MSFGRLVVGASLAFVLVASASSARADDDCSGWFCDEEGNSAPAPKPGDPGTATIPGDAGGTDVLTGVITEVVPGDHVTLKLPNGETKTLKWSQLLQLQVSGKIVIGGGAAAPAPAPAPPPQTVVIAPMPPAKPAPPPPPAAMLPPPEHEPMPHVKSFKERWALGVRLNFVSPGASSRFFKDSKSMRDYVGAGTGLEVNLGYRVSPAWTPYGFFEYARFATGNLNAASDDKVVSSMLGLGIHANTNPDGPVGLFFDIGIGYRWLTVPYGPSQSSQSNGQQASSAGGKVQFAGFETVRLGLGLSIVSSPHVRWDIALTGSAGSFSKRRDTNGGCVGNGDCETIPEDKRAAHAFGGFTIGALFDL